MTRLAWPARRRRHQPPWDRVRLTWRQRATWHRFRLRTGRDLRRQLAIAAIEADIDRLGRRLREHLGLEGGDA